jgi:hypothetical protein
MFQLAQIADTPNKFGDAERILWTAVGVLISVLLPVLSAYVKKKFAPAAADALTTNDVHWASSP